LLCISGFRNSIVQNTGVSTTRGGAERKIGSWFLNLLFEKKMNDKQDNGTSKTSFILLVGCLLSCIFTYLILSGLPM
jgi:hypothetical protein